MKKANEKEAQEHTVIILLFLLLILVVIFVIVVIDSGDKGGLARGHALQTGQGADQLLGGSSAPRAGRVCSFDNRGREWGVRVKEARVGIVSLLLQIYVSILVRLLALIPPANLSALI